MTSNGFRKQTNQLMTHKMKRFAIIAILAAFCVGAHAQEKIYDVKSGKVTMEMDMMGQTIVQEMYFDDYGAKQATLMEMRGRKVRSLEVDGKTTKYASCASLKRKSIRSAMHLTKRRQ